MLRRSAALSACLTVLCSLLFAGSAGPALAGEAADPMAGAPSVGDCYDLTLAQGDAETVPSDPVACADKHTTKVVGVKKLPADLTWSSDRKKIGAAVFKGCNSAFEDTVGSSQKILYRSQYTWRWFAPTDDEKGAGARWYSCHIAVWENDRLAPLPAKLPKLRLPLPNSVARCVTGAKTYAFTTCADEHEWRSTFTTVVFKRLTDANLDRASQAKCLRHVSSRTWLRSGWKITSGKFILGCYSKTRR